MAISINKVILLGNIGKDVEVRTSANCDKVASFSLATLETWKDKEGNKQTKTEWHNIVCFNKGLITLLETYTHKGSKVYVEGALRTRKWTDKAGVDKFTTEIVITKFNGDIVILDHIEKNEVYEQPTAQTETYDDDIPF